MAVEPEFWKRKPLAALSREEWEALCDGCGKCCLVLLRDDDTGEIYETDVACRLYDPKARRCTDYARRHQKVRDCVEMTAANVRALDWMPETCAYRLVAHGEDLAPWHPLVSGDRSSVAAAGAAASTRLLNEAKVAPEDLNDHITGLRR